MVLILAGCKSEADVVEAAVDIASCRNDVKKLNKGKLLKMSFEEMEKSSVKRTRKMSVETQATRRELGELSLATSMPSYFENFKGSKKGDAKTRQRNGTRRL